MSSSGLNYKCQDVQSNITDERLNNYNRSGEHFSDNVAVLSTVVTIPSDNNRRSENNSSVSQVPVKDDERDLIELMIASSTIPSAPSNAGSSVKTKSDKTSGNTGGSTRSDAKKRAKQQRELSRDVALLSPDNRKVLDEKAYSFALAYFLKVKDRLDEQSFLEFVHELSTFDNHSMTVCDLYRKVIPILESDSELSEEFLAFLLPEQAMDLGVYMEYLCFTKMGYFLRKLEVYFSKQPQQVRKIYECLARLGEQSASSKIHMSAIRSVMLPLLKGSSLLTEYFLQLFPYEQPPVLECADDKDFEKVDCGEFDETSTGVQHEDNDSWDWETVDIPDLEDPFGGDSCPCTCHSNLVSVVTSHCFSCGIKFINGRVFVQNGKVLRPAKLVIEGANKKEIIERIGKKPTLKNDDDKGGSSLRHRKRPAADTSPVKNNAGTSGCGNSSLLSPTGTESEEDISDFKSPSAKVKSPRNIKSATILKTVHNKTVSNKDAVKDCALHTEDDILNAHSFVLLDTLSTVNENKKDNVGEGSVSDTIIQSVSCEAETIDNVNKLKDCENTIPLLTTPPRSSTCIDSAGIRDDEDDDIEYIEIDDDDVDDDIDLVDEDDDDDDIEEYEEEIVHNDDDEEDYEDIEVIEIDEEEERDMDVDYLTEHNEDESNGLDEVKIDVISCDDGSVCVKDESLSDDNCTEKSNLSLMTTIKCKNVDEVLIKDIKVEVVDEEFKEGNGSDKPVLSSQSSEDILQSSDSKISSSDSQLLNCVEPTPDIHVEIMAEDTKESVEHVSLTLSLPPAEDSLASPHPVPPASFISMCTSWTKEEDKVILQTFQQEGDTDENFIMIRKQLPQRSVEEIKSRFNILLQLLKRMTTNKNNIE